MVDPTTQEAPDPRQVFVVHGRNAAATSAMFTFLRAIDLRPIEWDQAIAWTGEGSPFIGQVLDVAFQRGTAVVVLLTPDEIAYLQPAYAHGDDDPETAPAAQARPNVLFEAGMALGRAERRTILVEFGDLRPFSDVSGRHAIRMDNSASAGAGESIAYRRLRRRHQQQRLAECWRLHATAVTGRRATAGPKSAANPSARRQRLGRVAHAGGQHVRSVEGHEQRRRPDLRRVDRGTP